MKIRRFARYEGKVASYVHGGGKIGVLLSTDKAIKEYQKFYEEYFSGKQKTMGKSSTMKTDDMSKIKVRKYE